MDADPARNGPVGPAGGTGPDGRVERDGRRTGPDGRPGPDGHREEAGPTDRSGHPEPAEPVGHVEPADPTDRPGRLKPARHPEPAGRTDRAGDVDRDAGGPADQLAALLARADNGARAAQRVAAVRSALMHHCGLQSCRHTKGPPRPLSRRTYRHSFLLPDGGVRTLWELEHTTGPGGQWRYAVFTDREDLAVAEWEADAAFGPADRPAGGAPIGPNDPRVPYHPHDGHDGLLLPPLDDRWPPAGYGRYDEEPPYDDHPAAALVRQRHGAAHRSYPEGDSAEHAWRLLRRAANSGAPGEAVRSKLRSAVAHGISIVTRRSTVVGGRAVCWSLYEHAFLLTDGSELSLWEIDHTRTPSGEPVCEVYISQDAALDTAIRRIEAG